MAGIADFTIAEYGIDQARRYADDLEACFSRLAQYPLPGRSAAELAENVRRFKHGSHVVFYEAEKGGVLIVRVLRERMDPPVHP